MTRIVLGAEAWAALQSASGKVVICNPAGAAVGVFEPLTVNEYARGDEPVFNEEELKDALEKWEGRSLKDMISDLERMQ